MTARDGVKGSHRMGLLAAVISSPADLQCATRHHCTPDLFELRLDALVPIIPEVERLVPKLASPLIITARHPAEGGLHNLPPARRRDLLLRFLPYARYLDIELRSAAEMPPVLQAAAERRITRIISVHDFRRTPSEGDLGQMLNTARDLSADVFKIVTRIDTADDAERLLAFFRANQKSMPISAMATGKLGRQTRVTLARLGSALNYCHLGTRRVEGQLSVVEMRRALR